MAASSPSTASFGARPANPVGPRSAATSPPTSTRPRPAALLIDTVAPALTVTVDQKAAAHATLAAAIDADEDAHVIVTDLPGSESAPVTGDALTRKLKDGDYQLTFTASDASGNVTSRQLKVTILHPVTFREAIPGLLVMLAALVGLVLVVRAVRRRRRRAHA